MKWICTCGAVSPAESGKCHDCGRLDKFLDESQYKSYLHDKSVYYSSVNVTFRSYEGHVYDAADNYVKRWGSLSTHDWNHQATYRAGAKFGFDMAYSILQDQIEGLQYKLAEYTKEEK